MSTLLMPREVANAPRPQRTALTVRDANVSNPDGSPAGVAMRLVDQGHTPLPLCDKVPTVKWKHWQTADPDPAEVREWFRRPGVNGVGIVHKRGVAARDYDHLEGVVAYGRWREGHRDLADELPTVRTGDGVRVYFADPSPTHLVLDNGELIGPGHYSVLPPSWHPTSRTRYFWLKPWRVPLRELEPESAELVPKSLSDQDRTVTHPFSLNKEEWMRDTWPPGAWAAASRGDKIDDAIARTLPAAPRQREHKLLELVRALRPLFATADEAEPHVRRWWDFAFPCVRTKPWHKTWAAFRRAWENFGPRADALERSIILARAGDPPPDAAAAGYGAKVLLLAGICRELQRHASPEPFFLSCHSAARALDVPHPKQAMRWLQALRKDGLLRLERVGRHSPNPAFRRASEWRWEGAL